MMGVWGGTIFVAGNHLFWVDDKVWKLTVSWSLLQLYTEYINTKFLGNILFELF